MQAFIALIRSSLEYCSAVWDPHLAKDVNLLEAVQKRGARFVKQDYGRISSVTTMLEDLNWKPLKDRRREIRLALLFKILKGKIAVETEGILVEGDTRTRSSNSTKYRHLTFKTDQLKYSFFAQTIRDWNKTPQASIKADTPAPLASPCASFAP